MNSAKVNDRSKKIAKKLIKRVLSTSIENPNNPESIAFFQADTYRFYFLMSFMWEFFEGNEISQEYAISLVPRKFASRIKRLQVLKQAVQLGFIYEQQSEVDKRRRIYAPTEILLHDLLAYAESTNVVVEKNT